MPNAKQMVIRPAEITVERLPVANNHMTIFVEDTVRSSTPLLTEFVVGYGCVPHHLIYVWVITSRHVQINATTLCLCFESYKLDPVRGTEDMQ